MLGTEYTDTVTLGNGLVITKQSFGVGSLINSPPLIASDGILGLGPVILTLMTLDNSPDTTIPTVIDNLLIQGSISQRVISYFFAPTLQKEVTYGAITLGGINPADHTSPITYTYVALASSVINPY